MAVRFKKNPNTERKIINALSNALDKAAIVYENQAEINAPEKSGRLKRSFETKKPKILKRRIANNAPYAVIVEFGTLKRSPNPFMRNAIKMSKSKILNLFKGIF